MITIIVGSLRQDAQSDKVARYIKKQIERQSDSQEVQLLSLRELNLPLWNEENFEACTQWVQTSQQLQESSGFIIVTPEWDGMASPALKNFFNYCRNHELFHKPALLVAVSAGLGGSYPVAELRMSSYKNSRICYLPEHVLVRHVEEVLNHEEPINDNDQLIRERIEFALKVLKTYQAALEPIRKQPFLYDANFQNGM